MLSLKRSKLKLKTFLFIEVTFNISCHTIMTFTKKQKQFFDPQPTSHLQKWTIDLLIRKHVPNFKTPPLHPPPHLPYGRHKCMVSYRKGFKKRKWVETLQTSMIKSFISFWNTLFWFVWQSQIYVIGIKDKICYMIEVMSFKYLLFSQ